MKILALETSAKAASAAIVEGGEILAESTLNVGLTHSETLMPAVDFLLRTAKLSAKDLDAVAVSRGPGSFTGIRIGIGAAKGLAQGWGLPCVGVSTLEGLAWNFQGLDRTVCAVMDARCRQVYTALFRSDSGGVCRLREDEAIALDELGNILSAAEGTVMLTGDGAQLCFRELSAKCGNLCLAPPLLRFQRASSVAFAAIGQLKTEPPLSPAELMPVYLRLPQAERELNKKLGKKPE